MKIGKARVCITCCWCRIVHFYS